MIRKFALEVQKKSIQLTVEKGERLPLVCVDLGLIERAFGNLIDSALRHTPNGGSVRLRMHHVNDKVWISVTDDASGKAASDLPYIFTRFYCSNLAHEVSAVNAGIGLSIVRRIVNMHSELVDPGNVTERGTQFRVSLPVMGT